MLPEHMIPGTVAHAVLGLSQTAGQATFPNGGPIRVRQRPHFEVRFLLGGGLSSTRARVALLTCKRCGRNVDQVWRYTAEPWTDGRLYREPVVAGVVAVNFKPGSLWTWLLGRFRAAAAAHRCWDRTWTAS